MAMEHICGAARHDAVLLPLMQSEIYENICCCVIFKDSYTSWPFFSPHKRDYPCANHMQSLHQLVLICSFNLLTKIAFALLICSVRLLYYAACIVTGHSVLHFS